MNRDLEAMIFGSIGEASMCWSETPSGRFDDVRAAALARDLITAINEWKNNE